MPRGLLLGGLGGAKGPVRLYDDSDLVVLWLSRGSHELAVSEAGIWLRRGRQEADLPWPEVDQVQLLASRRTMGSARVEVFSGRTAWRLGPYPRPAAQRWVQACGAAAQRAGGVLTGLDGSDGFAIRV